jgi:hypothetical protein
LFNEMPMIEQHKHRPQRVRSIGWFLAAVWAACHPADLRAETVALIATLDATLIEDPAGDLANGAGPAFFAGRTSQSNDSRRRALVFFDVASALPRAASIKSAELALVLTPANDSIADVAVHRVLSPWSEGTSSASGGGGAPAVAGDATWLHTFYDTQFWAMPGGDFAPDPSGFTAVGSPGVYVWGTTPALEADVQSWLDEPDSNHGWLLIGNEEAPTTSKRFASRENPAEEMRPQLLVVYEITCEAAGLAPGAFGLCEAYCEALDCDGLHPRGSERACSRLARNFAARTNGAPLPCEPHYDQYGVGH